MMEPHYDVVCILLETPFCKWKEDDKVWILKNGRPTPSFKNNVVTTDSADYVCSSSWYELFPWLCGSFYLEKLLCWPCLINGIESYKMESVDFDNVTEELLNLHEASLHHLKSALKLKELSKTSDLYKNSSLNIVEQNKNILLNRHLMQLLIKAILFLTKRLLNVTDHDQNYISSHNSIQELFHLSISESPLELQHHYFNVKTHFESESLQNDLISCLCTHLIDLIKKDMLESPFYSIQLDRVSHSLCSLIARYVDSNGVMVEKLLGFLNVNKSCSIEKFFEHLETILNPLNYRAKLVAQSYDGACVIRENLNELQSKIKSQASEALFVHCYNHNLEEIIVQSLHDIPECRSFFTKLYSIPFFFNSSTRRLEMLNSAIKGKGKAGFRKEQLRKGYNIITAVYQSFADFKVTFKNILSDPSFDDVSLSHANTYLSYFKDMECIFLLLVFKFIFQIFQKLLNELEKQSLDMSLVLKEVDKIKVTLTNHHTSYQFNFFYKISRNKAEIVLIDHEECYNRGYVCEEFKQLYFKILDCIFHELDIRFKDSKNLQFMSLSDWSNFKSFSEVLPDNYIQSLIDSYPNIMTDINRLRNELKLFYEVIPYREYSILEIIKNMKDDKSCEIFKETYKLFCLIISIPCSFTPYMSVNNQFFISKIVQGYLKNHNCDENVQVSLAMLSVGQKVIDHLINTSMFYDNIINQFATLKNQKIPLIVQK